jgi:hypothetical protein
MQARQRAARNQRNPADSQAIENSGRVPLFCGGRFRLQIDCAGRYLDSRPKIRLAGSKLRFDGSSSKKGVTKGRNRPIPPQLISRRFGMCSRPAEKPCARCVHQGRTGSGPVSPIEKNQHLGRQYRRFIETSGSEFKHRFDLFSVELCPLAAARST